MAKYSLDFGPSVSGTPSFTIFRNLNTDEDLTPPTLSTPYSGVWDFTYSSGITVQFRCQLAEGYVAGTIDPRVEYPLGEGSISVDHNYGGTDNYIVLDEYTGAGIDNAFVYAYLASDYAAGRTSRQAYLRGWTVTDMAGRWEDALYLDPGSYTLLIIGAGKHPKTVALEVT